MLKLYCRDKLISTIKNEMSDDMAMVGEIGCTPAANEYKHVVAFFNDPDKRLYEEPPFSEELVENWIIEDESGKRTEIFAPAVNENNEIWWR